MSLDDLCWIASDRDALDHVRVKRSLSEKFVATVFAALVLSILLKQFLGRVLEHFDELVADQFSFSFWIGHSYKQREKTLAGVHVIQPYMGILAENTLHDFFLARAKQPIVYKNACELVTDGFVQQRSRYCRIDAAAQAEHDLLIAHLLANAGASLFDKG